MHDERSEDAALNALAGKLAMLTPRARLDRDRLMFAAGQRAATRRLRVGNRLLAAASLLCAGMVAVVLALPETYSRPEMRETSYVIEGPPLPAPQPVKPAPIAETKDRFTAVEGPTYHRLLQELAFGVETPAARQVRSAPTAETLDEPAAPAYPRVLLQRYLDDLGERL